MLQKEDLMCFMDVDLVFGESTLWRFSKNTQKRKPHFPIFFAEYMKRSSNMEDGYWRDSSFGMMCTYKSDFDDVGGFDLTIVDWGKEDIDLYERYVNNGFQTSRSIDPDLRHIFHPITCNIENKDQNTMCLRVKALTIAPSTLLAKEIITNLDIYNKTLPKRPEEIQKIFKNPEKN